MPLALTRNCVVIRVTRCRRHGGLLERLPPPAEEALGLQFLHRLRRQVLVVDAKVDALVHDRAHVHRAPHAQVEVLLETAVVLGHDVLGGKRAVGGVEAQPDLGHAREVVDAVRGAESKRRPAVLPGTARAGRTVEHHEILVGDELETAKVVGDGEACLAGSDHHDLHAFRARHHLPISARVDWVYAPRDRARFGGPKGRCGWLHSVRFPVLNWQPDEFIYQMSAG